MQGLWIWTLRNIKTEGAPHLSNAIYLYLL